jgi:hypothetical protein
MKPANCGSSSFGRARPCQGRGGRFEPGLPLRDPSVLLVDFFSVYTKVLLSPGGGTGRHAGLKILWAVRPVRVQLPSGAHSILKTINFFTCPGGEIGRRTTLRWWRPKGCAGSNPVSGTRSYASFVLILKNSA